MNVTVETVAPRRVAFIRHIGPYGAPSMHDTWARLCAWAGPKGLIGPQSQFLGLGHDDPTITPPDKIRYDACVTVGAEVQPEGEVGVQEIAGGDYAKAIHRGPYSRLHETYAMICGQWGPASGRDFLGAPSIEVYRNDPNSTPPDQLVTEVYVPLE